MSTTTLKLPDELKQKAVAAAQDLGVTPHAFMVDAIRQATEAAEQRKQFVDEAKSAHAEMLETGLGYEPADVLNYLRHRLESPDIPRPTAKPWRK
ncbi:MAG: hypothetical protein V4476_27840 [Pseudomonadota bacterium]